MARGKKKESALTPEEKLAQALVPDWEQPYRVPGNWCWTTLGSLVDTSKEKTEDFSDPDVKYVGLEHLEKDTGIIGSASAEGVKSLKNVFHPGQILYGKLRPYLNKHDVADFDGVCSTDILVFNVRKTAIAQYVDFFLNQRSFIEYAVTNSKGINLPRVSEGTVLDAVCPLPPLAEQQRIVDRIEYLFAKLDEAKEKAQSVLDSFETRKAAILHKAFTGELTAKWRAEHGVHFAPNNYSLIEVFNFIDYRGMTPDKTDSGIPLITAKNIKKGYIDYRISEYISPETYLQRLGRGIARRNDLLITTEAPLGNVALADQDTYSTAQRVIVLQLREEYRDKVNNKYVMHYMLDESFQTKLQDQKTGSTVAGIKAAKLKLIPIVLPCVTEQAEVVRILDSLFAKEQQAKDAAEAVLEKIDLLKKSILARAFRGELGTNDPSEESALELLKSVL